MGVSDEFFVAEVADWYVNTFISAVLADSCREIPRFQHLHVVSNSNIEIKIKCWSG